MLIHKRSRKRELLTNWEHKYILYTVVAINDINDRLIGYDPTEDDFYAIGNTEIMDEL